MTLQERAKLVAEQTRQKLTEGASDAPAASRNADRAATVYQPASGEASAYQGAFQEPSTGPASSAVEKRKPDPRAEIRVNRRDEAKRRREEAAAEREARRAEIRSERERSARTEDRRGWVEGVVTGSLVSMSRNQVPSGAVRWMRSLFTGAPYARRRVGTALQITGPYGTRNVVVYGLAGTAYLSEGMRVRVRGRVGPWGDLVARELRVDLGSGETSLMTQGQLAPWKVWLLTMLFALVAALVVLGVRAAVSGVYQSITRTSETASRFAGGLFEQITWEAPRVLSGILVIALMLWAIRLMLTGRYR